MLQAFIGRTKDYLDSNRDYFKARERSRKGGSRRERSRLAYPGSRAPQVILNFLQICTQHLGGVIQVDWPPFYKRMMSNLNFVNLNFLS